MLILARKVNQRILLPTVGTTMAVIVIRPGSVRLGIDAPPAVTVLREELLHRHHPPVNAGVEADGNGDKHTLCTRLALVSRSLESLCEQISVAPATSLDAMLLTLQDEVRALDRQVQALLADTPQERFAPALTAGTASS